MFHDRESKPGPTGIAGPVFVDPIEALENVRLVAQRDANAIVGNGHDDGALFGPGLNTDFCAGFHTMSQGIVHEIVKRLFDSKRIELDYWQSLWDDQCHGRPCLPDTRVELFTDPVDALP